MGIAVITTFSSPKIKAIAGGGIYCSFVKRRIKKKKELKLEDCKTVEDFEAYYTQERNK